jgi:hypothetical protein
MRFMPRGMCFVRACTRLIQARTRSLPRGTRLMRACTRFVQGRMRLVRAPALPVAARFYRLASGAAENSGTDVKSLPLRGDRRQVNVRMRRGCGERFAAARQRERDARATASSPR